MFDSRFESKWRSSRPHRLRSRSKLLRKRSCLPQQVALRVSWTFPENAKQTIQQAVTLVGEPNFSIHFEQALLRPVDYRA